MFTQSLKDKINRKKLMKKTDSMKITDNEIKGALSRLRQFFAAESPTMKNVFYFNLKALLVLKIVTLLFLTFLVMDKNGWIWKKRLISKLMASQPV